MMKHFSVGRWTHAVIGLSLVVGVSVSTYLLLSLSNMSAAYEQLLARDVAAVRRFTVRVGAHFDDAGFRRFTAEQHFAGGR